MASERRDGGASQTSAICPMQEIPIYTTTLIEHFMRKHLD